TDAVVMQWNRAYMGAILGKNGYTAEEAAVLLHADRPQEMCQEEFARRMIAVVTDPLGVVEGHELLKKLVQKEIDELTEWQELIALREERDIARAIMKAQGD